MCGEYLLEECVFAKYDGFVLPPGLYSWNLVKYLVEKKLIEKKAIKKMLLPCGELPAEDLKLFVDEVSTKFAENEAKAIVNMFIGNMGSKYNKEIKGCITDSEVEARSLQALYDHIEIFEMNGLYLVKQVAKERLVEDNTSINRFLVCGGILKVFETMRLTMVCGVSRLVSIRTDCV